MTLDTFRLLAPRAQVMMALLRGTYLAQRLEVGRIVKLYHFPDGGRGFFVELGIHDGHRQPVALRGFSDSQPLEEYVRGVRLLER